MGHPGTALRRTQRSAQPTAQSAAESAAESAAQPLAQSREQLGRLGESLAARHLEHNGAEILAQNIRFRVGEIDLVAREQDGTVVFVEVKTRRGAGYGHAEAVTAEKFARMRRAARQWLSDKPHADIRFDVITVMINGHAVELEHYQGVQHGAS